jgi:hypothetical protein
MKYLNDTEKELVLQFVENEKMFNAVRKVILHTIYSQGTFNEKGIYGEGNPMDETNWIFGLANNPLVENNIQLGERVRATVEGIGYMNSAFTLLKEVKVDNVKPKDKVNNAI